MIRLFYVNILLILFPSSIMMSNPINEALNWAEVTSTRLVNCYYNQTSGLWINELAWQSGNTLESLANFISLRDSSLKYVFYLTLMRTGMFVGGDCFDDYQWWLLGWMQIYSVDPNLKYLYRAADIHDVITTKAWNTTQCQGGIQWCPNSGYKNAITNELFLAGSMRLHPYATLLGKPSNYYLNWALKEWQWFENSGMINGDYLINDGLNINNNICTNNNQTTWTYNQGVILSGLALLYNATGNTTLLTVAQSIADATIEHLTYPNEILKEPCEPKCDNDQKLFKGIFARHLNYLLPHLTDRVHIEKYSSFLEHNALSLWTTDRCGKDGLFGVFWDYNNSSDSCEPSRDSATTTSSLDLFLSAAKTGGSPTSTKWILLGQGNCMDDNGVPMPNFYSNSVNETVCRATADQDSGSVAYDFQLECNGDTFCRIRTLSDQQKTPPGFEYGGGDGRTVTRTNQLPLNICFLKHSN